MTDKLQNETPERINLAHSENETPDVVGHVSVTNEKPRLSARGEDGAGQDVHGRLAV